MTGLELLPFVGKALALRRMARGAVTITRRAAEWRARAFFETVDRRVLRLDPEQQRRYHQHFNSHRGQQSLLDFQNSVLRTSAPTALACLAVLMSESTLRTLPPGFLNRACHALEGATERELEFFMCLRAYGEDVKTWPQQKDTPFPVLALNEARVQEISTKMGEALSVFDAMTLVEQISERRLVFPDPAENRLGGDEWMAFIGWTPDSDEFVRLIDEARSTGLLKE